MGRKVLDSFDSPDRSHCVDVFIRDNGTFGFEEFRGESDGAATTLNRQALDPPP